ncbi:MULTISPECIES: VOC family protein [unclassified Frankia]|uniref:VOC family protein n=1 Tax=unclassified Frankia TaxID=2632575 RepID=UPI002AD28D30|nr:MULTISPECIES: VOC family protein [unclassified Frankia]
MQVTSTTLSLTVDDVAASRDFLVDHFGYRERVVAEGFVSLGRDDAAVDIVLLRRGIEVLPEGLRDQSAAGVIVALVVADLAAQEARLRREGVPITMPMQEEEWGERLFQVTDPNGVVIQLVEWVEGGHSWAGDRS